MARLFNSLENFSFLKTLTLQILPATLLGWRVTCRPCVALVPGTLPRPEVMSTALSTQPQPPPSRRCQEAAPASVRWSLPCAGQVFHPGPEQPHWYVIHRQAQAGLCGWPCHYCFDSQHATLPPVTSLPSQPTATPHDSQNLASSPCGFRSLAGSLASWSLGGELCGGQNC